MCLPFMSPDINFHPVSHYGNYFHNPVLNTSLFFKTPLCQIIFKFPVSKQDGADSLPDFLRRSPGR